jgi:hypothetical protein
MSDNVLLQSKNNCNYFLDGFFGVLRTEGVRNCCQALSDKGLFNHFSITDTSLLLFSFGITNFILSGFCDSSL